MSGGCGLGTHTYRVGCKDAHGLRAGALIAVLGGLRAEGRPVVAPTLGITEDVAISLSDVALIRAVYSRVLDLDVEDEGDVIILLLTEAFERFAPEAAWAADEAGTAEVCSDDEDLQFNLEDLRRAWRRREGARMIRGALEGGSDA
jgi:hypothetical protein